MKRIADRPNSGAVFRGAARYSSKTDLGGYKYDGAQLRATYLYRFQ